MNKKSVVKAIKKAGGTSAVATHFGVSYQAVQQWAAKGIPVKRVIQMEALSGIPRHVLCPEVFPDETQAA